MSARLDENLDKAYGRFRQDHEALRDALMASLPKGATKEKRSGAAKRLRQFTGGLTMNNRIAKIAIAAAVVVAILLGLHYLGGSPVGTTVAWGQVAKNMDAINRFTCRMTSWERPVQTLNDKEPPQETGVIMQFSYSDEYGFKMEQYTGGTLTMIEYMLRKTNEGGRIWPQEKTYFRTKLSEQERAMMSPQEMDPREWVRRFLSANFKPLGQKTIDGVQAEGIEINELGVIRKSSGPSTIENYAARLWVSIDTQLPVRIEEEYTLGSIRSGGGSDQFRWNPPLSATDIEPVIPADYTPRS
jgi:hypothetical protein